MRARVRPIILLIAAVFVLITPLQFVRAQVYQVTSIDGPYGSGAIRVVSHPDGSLIAISSQSVFRSVDDGHVWVDMATAPEPPLRGLAVTGDIQDRRIRDRSSRSRRRQMIPSAPA